MTTNGYLLRVAQSSPAAQDAALTIATWLESLDAPDSGRAYEPVASGEGHIWLGCQEAWDKSEQGLLVRWLANEVLDPQARVSPASAYSTALGALLILEDLGMVKIQRRFHPESERRNFVVSVRIPQPAEYRPLDTASWLC